MAVAGLAVAVAALGIGATAMGQRLVQGEQEKTGQGKHANRFPCHHFLEIRYPTIKSGNRIAGTHHIIRSHAYIPAHHILLCPPEVELFSSCSIEGARAHARSSSFVAGGGKTVPRSHPRIPDSLSAVIGTVVVSRRRKSRRSLDRLRAGSSIRPFAASRCKDIVEFDRKISLIPSNPGLDPGRIERRATGALSAALPTNPDALQVPASSRFHPPGA